MDNRLNAAGNSDYNILFAVFWDVTTKTKRITDTNVVYTLYKPVYITEHGLAGPLCITGHNFI